MQAKLLEKIEELTLHMIESQKQMQRLSDENQVIREKLARQDAVVASSLIAKRYKSRQ